MSTDNSHGWMSIRQQVRWQPRQIVVGMVLIACYVGLVQLGWALKDARTHIIPVYPAAGFASAVLLRFGWRRIWLWTTLGIFVGAWSEGSFARYYPVACGNLAAILLPAVLVERFGGGARFLERPENVFRFVVLGAVLLGLMSATFGMGYLVWLGESSWEEFVRHGIGWGVGDVVGVLLVVPPLLTWTEDWIFPRQSLARWAEMLALLVICVSTEQLSFGAWPFPPHRLALEYLTIPVLLWAAFRFPQRGGTTATLLVATLAILNTLAGRGSFAHNESALTLLQIYLGSVSMLVLVIAASVRRHETQAVILRRAFSEAEAARAEAEKADRAKSAFLSRISHELRSPLNVILGFGQILKSQAGKDEMVAECSGHILDAGRHLLTLVDEVLDLTSLERRQLPLALEPVEIGSVVRECLDLLAGQAKEREIVCHVEGAAGVVRADRTRLRQAVSTVLSNAILYSRVGGTVTVSFVETGGGSPADHPTQKGWRIRIADTGQGISVEDQTRLFVPFQRLETKGVAREGSGLGLSMAKGLIEAMGGRLGVDSSPGQGSVFWIELPTAEPALAGIDPAAEPKLNRPISQ